MGRSHIVYASSSSQGSVNDTVMRGLSDYFDVRFARGLTPDLVRDLKDCDEKFGLITHFPIGVQGVSGPFGKGMADDYAGAAALIRDLRCNMPDLPIVVYTGASCVNKEPSEFMRGLIIGAGANDVVFKYGFEKEIEELREKMSLLLRKI